MRSKFGKLLALLMALLMVVSIPAGIVSFADAEENAENDTAETKLPSSVTLVGTEHLPPISNQGAIGTCASQSITHLQFSNAVSRYLHSIDPDIEWNPSSGDLKYIFSPKFTYQYTGAGTAWVYDFLIDQGCLTMADSYFEMDPNTGAYKMYRSGKNVYKQTALWEVGAGMLQKALNYRLTNYEQIWLTNDYKVNGKVAITTSEAGQNMIQKIKQSLNNGNVVVTGGYPSRWVYSTSLGVRLASTGTLAKSKTEAAIVYSQGNAAGGHQVSIVGYDDNIALTYKGVTLQGAFLVANSWGDSWMNDGYVWMMYDALNEVSEFSELNVADRTWTMDQMCFVDWEKDIEIGLPDLMVEVEVETTNRDGAAVYILRKSTDENGKEVEEKFIPIMYQYGPLGSNAHTDFDTGSQFTFSGSVVKDNTAAEKGYFTINLDQALEIPEGKTFGDYEWGVRLWSCEKTPATYKSVKLVTANGTVLATLDVGEGITVEAKQSSKSEIRYFDFDGAQAQLPSGEGYTTELVSGDTYMAVGGEYSFKVNVEEGYSAENLAVTLNGTALTPNADGIYTVTSTAKDEVVVTGVALAATDDAGSEGDGKTEGGNMTTYIIIGVVIAVVAVAVIVLIFVRKPKKAGKTK